MKKIIRTFLLVILDIVLITCSVFLAYKLRFDGASPATVQKYKDNIQLMIEISVVVKLITFYFCRLYNSLWRYAGAFELFYIIAASFISNAVIMSYIFIAQAPVPRSIFIIVFFIDMVFIGGLRLFYRVVRRIVNGEFSHKGNHKHILIIGGGDAGAIVVKEFKLHPDLEGRPVAIIDDDPYKHGKKLNGVPVVGGRHAILKTVQKKQIKEIIIAIPSVANRQINEIYDICLKTQCKIKILPAVSQLIDESVIIQKIREVNIEDLLGREPIKMDCEEIASYLSEQVVLVTGGGGSIGSELCRQIASFGPKQLIILDNYENNAFEIQNELLIKFPKLNLATVIASVREKQRLECIFGLYRPDVVFHAAAHKHVPLMESNPTEAVKNNVFGTMNVAECADKFRAKRFVLISTDKAVNPTNIMGATKRLAEITIQSINKHSSTEFVAVRFGNVLGSNGSVIPTFKKQIELGGPVTVTHPEITRFFMTIPEAVQLVMQAGAMANGGEIFVLDMGEPVKIYDLAKNLIKLSGFEPEEDIKIEFTGLRPGEKLYEELLMAEEGLESTKNNKIFVAQPVFTDLAMLKREIECLKDTIMTNPDGVMEYVQMLVPSYKKSGAS